MRTTSGVAADSTGGDFRFQGQWLESATGLYNFRARDYDSRTGAFLSRDPVDSTEQDPEALNPYQAMYNNSYVYSDPSGMISLSEINVGKTIEKILDGIASKYKGQVSRKLLNQAQGVLTDFVSSDITSLAPFDPSTTFGQSEAGTLSGNLFQRILSNTLCRILGETYSSLLNNVWFEAGVGVDGRVQSNGYSCGVADSNYSLRYASPANNPVYQDRPAGRKFPDFIIRGAAPLDRDRVPPFNDTRPPAYVIGDFKLSSARSTMGITSPQGRAIFNYAQAVWQRNQAGELGHQYIPVALFLVYKGNPAEIMKERARAMRRYRVDLRVVSFFPR